VDCRKNAALPEKHRGLALAAEMLLNTSRTMPKVSICLPNLNTAKYLPERLDSILAQTFQDWECIVSDNFSTDGAWEIFQSYAARDSRFKLEQVPRSPLGMYPNWNNCLRRATGEFVYIATSDDTMSPDCLEKMVSALEEHPECGLCQCALEIIDENSKLHAYRWKEFAFGRFAPEWVETRHVRPAPVDGLLHCVLQTVYTSITQLLIRKRVFDNYGLFETQWGSVADFEWGMRVGFLESCVYVPEFLATWRKHPEQATGLSESASARRKMLAMSKVAYQKAVHFNPSIMRKLPPKKVLLQFYEEQILAFGLAENRGRMARFRFLAKEVMGGNFSALRFITRMKPISEMAEKSHFQRLNYYLKCLPSVQF
jgi:glycosyltransferase involved in cell wall biosynthesis